MSETAPIRVEEVTAEEVRPLRLKYLRPGSPPESVRYECDALPTTRHYAVRDEAGKVVAVGTTHPEDRLAGLAPYLSPGMRIRGLAVDDEWRGRGVAAAVLEHMLAWGREHGLREAWGNARAANEAFFRRHGFREVSSAYEVPGVGVHMVVARDLSRLTRAEKRSGVRRPETPEGALTPEAPESGPDPLSEDLRGSDGD